MHLLCARPSTRDLCALTPTATALDPSGRHPETMVWQAVLFRMA